MGGVSERRLLSVRGGRVRDSRSTPNPGYRFGGSREPDPASPLGRRNFSEAAMGWTRGLCIQLASIQISDPLRGVANRSLTVAARQVKAAGFSAGVWGCGGEPGRGWLEGAVAQLGERLICIQEVAGSIPTSSTRA